MGYNLSERPTPNERERKLDRGDFIVSKTDVRGVITYVNSVFIDIAKYSETELIGAPHNIVRHPDMPKAAFKDLWDTINGGNEWRGLVKNLCKDGCYYWVDAYVVPIITNGVKQGYTSMRRAVTDEEIKNIIPVYEQMIREEK